MCYLVVCCRWAYQTTAHEWVELARGVLMGYSAPDNCVNNEDGSTYADHIMTQEDFNINQQLVCKLLHSTSITPTYCLFVSTL